MNKQKKTPKERCEDSVKEYFRFFNEVYSSEKEMLEYCLKFQQIYQTPMRAFEEFFSLSQFYRAMKLMEDDFAKLIMIISLIEKLSSKKDYIDFGEWVSIKRKENPSWNETIEKAWSSYNEEFGFSHKFRNFFRNPKYLNETEQLELLKSVYYYIKNADNSYSLVSLFCYDEEVCRSVKTPCLFRLDKNCPAFKDKEIVKDGIKEFADFLYRLRSKFVHDALMFGLSGEAFGTTALLVTYVPYRFRYIKRPSYDGNVVLRLSGKKLEEILNSNFKKLLSEYIAMRKPC